MLKQILPALKLLVTAHAVTIPFGREFLKDGRFEAHDMLAVAAEALLDELARLMTLLSPMRTEVKASLAATPPAA